MLKKLKISILMVACIYILISILSVIVHSKVDADFIGKWGLVSGFILLITAVPLFKIVFYGGSVHKSALPYDEQMRQKALQQYEKEYEKDSEKNSRIQDIFAIAGIILIVLSIFIL